HCVDVVNIDVECPILVERDRMRRAGFVEENCYPFAPDDTECRRLAKKFARVKSELFAVKCFTRHYVPDFNRGGAVDDVYQRRNSITWKVGWVARFPQDMGVSPMCHGYVRLCSKADTSLCSAHVCFVCGAMIIGNLVPH